MGEMCTTELKKQLFDFIPSIFNYEEEGEKLVFDILIMENLSLTKQKMPTFLFQKMININKKNLNLKKYIKSMAPFSKNSWNIFISIEKNDNFSFGIYKNINSSSSIELKTLLDNFIEISKLDKDMIMFQNKNGLFHLCLTITKKDITKNRKSNIKNMVNTLTSSIPSNASNIEEFKINLRNFLFQSLEKIHGTIIVIVDSDKKLEKYFNNGVVLENPINLFLEYSNYLQDCSKEDGIIQKYYSLMGILSIALNIDGVTIINTKSEIIAYNVFIDNNKDKVDTSIVSGGARKRAAHSIENSKIDAVRGLYFQSHDGDNDFKELKNK